MLVVGYEENLAATLTDFGFESEEGNNTLICSMRYRECYCWYQVDPQSTPAGSLVLVY